MADRFFASNINALTSPRLCIIEQALYTTDTPEADLQRLSVQRAEQLLAQIKSVLPTIREHLCYLDVVFLLPLGAGGVSRGFVTAPAAPPGSTVGPVGRYSELIRRLVRGNCDVAGHPVFRAGLPRLTYGGQTRAPSTAHELNELKRGTPDWFPSDITEVRERFLEKDLGPSDAGNVAAVSDRRFETLAWSIKRESTEANYGGPDRTIDENFAEYCALLATHRDVLADSVGRRLQSLLAVPFSWWVRHADGRYRLSPGGSVFLGTSAPLQVKDRDTLLLLFAEATGSGYLVQEFASAGRRAQQVSFAHQTSSVIDTIVSEVQRLPEHVRREELGGALMAKLHLLRATINSYRTEGSRVDMGDFPYPWAEGEPVLAVYRDIGIQLGLARAQDGRDEEAKVREQGSLALRPENQPGQPGFDAYRDALFAPLPPVRREIEPHLRHSSFAVLILHALKQAVYHTLRARLVAKSAARISLAVTEDLGDVVFECVIVNPRVTEVDQTLTSKDASELADLALRVSRVRDRKSRYSVEGPHFDGATDSWRVVTRIHSVS